MTYKYFLLADLDKHILAGQRMYEQIGVSEYENNLHCIVITHEYDIERHGYLMTNTLKKNAFTFFIRFI